MQSTPTASTGAPLSPTQSVSPSTLPAVRLRVVTPEPRRNRDADSPSTSLDQFWHHQERTAPALVLLCDLYDDFCRRDRVLPPREPTWPTNGQSRRGCGTHSRTRPRLSAAASRAEEAMPTTLRRTRTASWARVQSSRPTCCRQSSCETRNADVWALSLGFLTMLYVFVL